MGPIVTLLVTPLATKPKLDVDLSGEPQTNLIIVGKFGHSVLTSSRPDLVQAVCYCARYQARPTQKHLKEVKRIFKYLKGTILIGDSGKALLEGYKFLGDKIVSWMSKKQNCTYICLGSRGRTIAISCNPTEYQLADMFTKALLEDRFKYLVRRIGMRCLTPADLEVLTNETA
ncbi:hypothetical protein Tco_0841373 [Tanacetum coccineum]|uniref:Uncharacterized protein n=1 Tax=Tanacetum coccineum TaxID=301880 RepID=A0ABQ5AX72_9ASTR